MSLSFLQAFLDWINQNTIWSGIIIFLIACSESLALVGLIVPGAVLMFAIGTLITTGHLEFWTVFGWAVAGAIAGDGISYWLGYYYQDRLARLWPLSHHPDLLDKGQRFFDKHGGKSVLFGRFFGPLRPIVPAIAGMTAMPLRRFILINVFSGFAWAPLYLLPGMAFGLSLALAGEVAGRLVAAILLLLVSIFIALWLGKLVYKAMLPRIDNILFSITNWSRHHPVAGHIPDALIKPEHPEVRILSLLALMLFLASSLFIATIQFTGEASLMQQLNKLIQTSLAALHNPWFDRLMLGINAWATTPGIILISLFSMAWLFVQHNRLAIWHLLAALLLTGLLAYGLPEIFTAPEIRLPSGPIMMFTAVTGFIVITLAREIPQGYHLLVYLAGAGLVFLTSFARIYLQLDAFTEVLGGVMLGSIWLAIVGIAYRRHVHQPYVKTWPLLFFVIVQVFILGVVTPSFPVPAQKQAMTTPIEMSLSDWQEKSWNQLALIRNDIRFQRNHPLNLQWAGNLKTIQTQLRSMGWEAPVSAQSLSLLQWFNPSPDDRALPLLPQVHDGHYDEIRMVRFGKQVPEYLRLWKTTIMIKNTGDGIPLWLGSVGKLYRQRVMGLTLFRTSTDYAQTPQNFIQLFKTHYPKIKSQSRTTHMNGVSSPVFLILSQ
ncbi:MAG: VTT domain-containing protein [Gammaproteobacteria bacterium]|nr:VTT domain-containing protein [Gammaproteobacteria bacterium]